MHFQYIYCVSTSTPTCFGPFGPSSGRYTVKCDQVLKQYAVYIKQCGQGRLIKFKNHKIQSLVRRLALKHNVKFYVINSVMLYGVYIYIYTYMYLIYIHIYTPYNITLLIT
jgi:hypothetical protein